MMRHAPSEDTPPGASQRVRDHDRPITPAGAAAAAAVARALAAKGWLPDLILASDAARSRQTLAAMAEAVPELAAAPAHFRGALYTAAALDGQTAPALAAALAEAGCADDDEDCEVVLPSPPASAASAPPPPSTPPCTVLALGHNKGWEEAASALAGCAVRLEAATAALLEEAVVAAASPPSWPAALLAGDGEGGEGSGWTLVGLVSADG